MSRSARLAGFVNLATARRRRCGASHPDDGLVYYSPREEMRSGAIVKGFTAIGRVRPGDVYQAQQTESFCPFRHDVDYFTAHDAPITPMLEHLTFTAGGANWGWLMRRGMFEISEGDFSIIANAMSVTIKRADSSVR